MSTSKNLSSSAALFSILFASLITACSSTGSMGGGGDGTFSLDRVGSKAVTDLKNASFESLPLFQARDLLPVNLLTGPHFKVNDPVTSDGSMYHFQLSSDYGVFPAGSMLTLKERIREVSALAELAEISDAGTVVRAAGKEALGVAMAPVNTVEGLASAVIHPKETGQMIANLPSDVGRLMTRIGGVVQTGAQGAYAAGKGVIAGDNKAAQDNAAQGADVVENEALRHIGFNENEMDWYKKLSVDPYTTNQIVRQRVSHLAGIQSAIGIGFRFVPGFNLGIIGEVGGYLNKVKKVDLYANPDDLDDESERKLKNIGVDKALGNTFMRNSAYSPPMRLSLLQNLASFEKARDKNTVIIAANRAVSREEAIFFLRAVQYLANRQRDNGDIVDFEGEGIIPSGYTVDSRLIIPLPVDYLVWTESNAIVITAIKEDTRRDHVLGSIEVVVSGTVSPIARKELSKTGITVRESVDM